MIAAFYNRIVPPAGHRFGRGAGAAGGLALWLALTLLVAFSVSAATITEVQPVNVTPTSFSVIFSSSEPVTPGVAVFADVGGTTNLAGQVGIEPFPLHTGPTVLAEGYDRRQYLRSLQAKTMGHGLGHVRVTRGLPNTIYYYRIFATDTNGVQTVWPPSGPLPSVTTASESALVPEAKQLVVDLPGADAEGQIVTLSHPSAAYPLAAVAGDGAGTNQAIFGVSDLMTLAGGTNFVPIGSQQFEAELVGAVGGANTYTLNFTAQFAVASPTNVSFTGGTVSGELTLALGSTVVRAGDAGSVPVSLASTAGLTSVDFTFDAPTGRLAGLTIQSLSPIIQNAAIQVVSPTRWQVSLLAQTGQTISGTQQVAQINFTTVAGQTSAFVPVQLTGIQGTNSANGAFGQQFGQSGRVVVVGDQPLLEAKFGAAGAEDLIVYGKPGATYQIQVASNLGGGQWWSDWMRTSLTGLIQILSDVDPPVAVALVRAYEVIPPRLELRFTGGVPELSLNGMPGFSYQVEIATSLGGPWSVWDRIPLTGGTQAVQGPLPPGVFFRAREFVADPPLLETRLAANSALDITFYGRRGASYQIQVASALGGGWAPLMRVPLTNSFATLSGITSPSQTAFYRVNEFVADPPLLDALLGGGQGSLILYGQPGVSYQLQYTTSLGGAVIWRPQLDFTLTDSFQFVSGLTVADPLGFYRIVEP